MFYEVMKEVGFFFKGQFIQYVNSMLKQIVECQLLVWVRKLYLIVSSLSLTQELMCTRFFENNAFWGTGLQLTVNTFSFCSVIQHGDIDDSMHSR